MASQDNAFANLIPKNASSGNAQSAYSPQANDNAFASMIPQSNNADSMNGSILDSITGIPGYLSRLTPDMMKLLANPGQAVSDRTQAMGRGFTDIGDALKQIYLQTTGQDQALQDFTKKADIERANYDQSSAGQDRFADVLRTGARDLPVGALAPIPGAEAGLLTKLGMGAAGGAGIGALQYVPEGDSRLVNMAKGAGLGAVIPNLPGILNEARPTRLVGRFMDTPLSSQELARNLEATAGTRTGLGEVIASPTMKRLQENVITKIPLTGGNSTLQEVGSQIINRGNSIVENLRGDVPHVDVTDRLGESLITAKKEQTAFKNELYKIPEKRADEIGFQLKLPQFAALANKHANAIENTSMLQFEPDMKAMLGKLRNYKSPVKTSIQEGAIVDKTGKPILSEEITQAPTLKEANILAGRLNEMANKYNASINIQDRNAARVFGQLGKALKNDIKNSINKSGDKKLIESFNGAESNYANNYSSFLDKDIHKFTTGNESPDTLVSKFLQSSNTSDKADQLQKLMKVLPEDQRRLVQYSYLSRALEGPEDMRVVNPNKLKTLWDKLGIKQRAILFPNQNERRALDNFVILTNKNQKAVNMMWNPSTGQMNSDLITAILLQHPVNLAKEVVLGRSANNFLTNEDTRNEIVNMLMQRKQRQGQ